MVDFRSLIVAGLLAAVTAAAQTTGALAGIAFDPAGLVVANCDVSIVSPATGSVRTLTTGADGFYLAPNLAPGTYRVSVSRQGFGSVTLDDVEIRGGNTTRADIHLLLSERRDAVTVTSQPALLSTSAADWGGSIRRAQLEGLPLKNRDTFDLVAQQPGASIPSNTNKSLVTGIGTLFAVNGSRPWQNAYRLDGVFINEASGGAPSSASGNLLGIEALEEVQLVTSPFSADLGRATGGVFTAVSRSGSNALHGAAYGYLRNNALDAKNFFDAKTSPIPPLRKQQYGAMVSGPVLRNRLFFLGNYEGVRRTSSETTRQATISADARKGILTPGTAPVPVSPLIVPFLSVFPLPNGRDLGNGAGEYINPISATAREHFATGKADWLPASNLRSAFRYSYDRGSVVSPDAYEHWVFPNLSRYHIFSNETTYVSSPTTIYNFRFGYSRVRNQIFPEAVSDVARNLSFLPGMTLGVFRITGLDSTGGGPLGGIGSLPRLNQVEDFQFNHDASLIRGTHVWRYGAGYDRIRLNNRADANFWGLYRFSSITDFLAARPRTGELIAPGSDSLRSFRQNLFFGFIQDEWRVARGLQLTLGVRYETYSTPTEVDGKIATFRDVTRDTKTHIGGPLFENPSRLNFAPRAAIAWDVNGNGHTVVRAGAGLFFDTIGTRDLQLASMRMPPFFTRLAPANPTFPNLLSAAQSGTTVPTPDALDYYQEQPYVAQFQFRVEHQLGQDTVVQVGYAGSRGIHLMGFLNNINVTVPQKLPDGRLFFAPGAPRINPAFGNIAMRRSQFDSYYHALNLFVQRRLRGGLQFQAKYTWSKSIDNNSVTLLSDFISAGGFPTVFDYRSNRGLSDFDLRHDFAGSFLWQIPGPGAGLAKRVFGGWSMDGLVQIRSGHPFSPSLGFDRGNLQPSGADQGQRPSYNGMPRDQIMIRDVNRWYDASAFTLPDAGFLGNLGRNVLTGPGLFTLDLAVRKALWQTERQAVTLRAESYNLTNHPNFSSPGGSALELFDSRGRQLETAGRIVSTSTSARQLQLSLRWAF